MLAHDVHRLAIMQLPGNVLKATAFFLHFTVSLAITVAAPSRNLGYGPKNCVSVERSATGSCVVHTNCHGLDLSQYDFKFDCVEGPTARQTHSLGVGSFDETEDFDTDVQCQQCLPPPQVDHSLTGKPSKQGTAKKVDVKVASGTTQKVLHSGVKPPHRVATLLSHSAGRSVALSKPPIHPAKKKRKAERMRRPSQKKVTSVLQLRSVASPSPSTGSYPFAGPAPAPPATGPATGHPAAQPSVPPPPEQATPQSATQAVTATTTSAPWPDGPAEVYGPGMCISTWRNRSTGTCVLQTECAPHTDMANYDFGFLCTREDGNITRHLYGSEFFELHATFVSDIQCARCRALEDKPMDSISSVTSLVSQVSELRKEMVNISTAIIKLKQRAIQKAHSAGSPAPAPPAEGPPPPGVMVQARATVTEGSSPDNSNSGVVVAASEEGLSQVAQESTSNEREQDAGEAEMESDAEEDATNSASFQEAGRDVASSQEEGGETGEGMAGSETDAGGQDDQQEEGVADDEAQYGETEDSGLD